MKEMSNDEWKALLQRNYLRKSLSYSEPCVYLERKIANLEFMKVELQNKAKKFGVGANTSDIETCIEVAKQLIADFKDSTKYEVLCKALGVKDEVNSNDI